MPRSFRKPAKSVEDLIDLCCERNLQIDDRGDARKHFLSKGYYRLSGYMIPFQSGSNEGNHTFDDGTKIEHIIALYEFDQSLRYMLVNELEKIEIYTRAAISDTMSLAQHPFWFMDTSNFRDLNVQTNLIENLDKEKEIFMDDNRDSNHLFLTKYFEKYTDPPHPPSWMVFEILTFGTISRIFLGLIADNQQKIAERFGLHRRMLASWLHSMSVLRNYCAHHSRLWNRIFGVPPRPDTQNLEEHFQQIDKFYAQAVVIKILLDQTEGSSEFTTNLKQLFANYKSIPKERMGFPVDWENSNIWTTPYTQVIGSQP